MVDVIPVGIFLVVIFYFNRDRQNTKILSLSAFSNGDNYHLQTFPRISTTS